MNPKFVLAVVAFFAIGLLLTDGELKTFVGQAFVVGQDNVIVVQAKNILNQYQLYQFVDKVIIVSDFGQSENHGRAYFDADSSQRIIRVRDTSDVERLTLEIVHEVGHMIFWHDLTDLQRDQVCGLHANCLKYGEEYAEKFSRIILNKEYDVSFPLPPSLAPINQLKIEYGVASKETVVHVGSSSSLVVEQPQFSPPVQKGSSFLFTVVIIFLGGLIFGLLCIIVDKSVS